jgi:hypothetical protein
MGKPGKLTTNIHKSFQGSIVLGKGFILTPEEAFALIDKDPRNKEVLFPYLNGDDLNNSPTQEPSRWVINFFDWSEEKARTYPDCFDIVERLVRPERLIQKDKGGKEKWWQFLRPRKELYTTISELDQVMVIAQVSKTLAFTFVPTNQVISMMCIVLTFDDYLHFGLLQNSIHQSWVQKYASALKSDTRYTPSDVFETFPLPKITDNEKSTLEVLAKSYFSKRKEVMERIKIGLTKTYNLFHDRNLHNGTNIWLKKHLQKYNEIGYSEINDIINEMRSLQARLDNFVLLAYGWNDLNLKHDFYNLEHLPGNDRTRFTIHPDARREVLKRLLLLNHQLYKEEESKSSNIMSKSKKRINQKNENNSPKLF